MNYPTISGLEALILSMLTGAKPVYGMELLQASGGQLKRGSIYTMLDRMIAKGFVTDELDKDPQSEVVPASLRIPRRKFSITGKGAAALAAHTAASEAYSQTLSNSQIGPATS